MQFCRLTHLSTIDFSTSLSLYLSTTLISISPPLSLFISKYFQSSQRPLRSSVFPFSRFFFLMPFFKNVVVSRSCLLLLLQRHLVKKERGKKTHYATILEGVIVACFHLCHSDNVEKGTGRLFGRGAACTR